MSRALPLRRKRNSGMRSPPSHGEIVFGVMFNDDDTGASPPESAPEAAPIFLQAKLATDNDDSRQGLQRFELILRLPSADQIWSTRGGWHYFRERRRCQVRMGFQLSLRRRLFSRDGGGVARS